MPTKAPGWIAQYVGREFRERGRSRDGVDCWGLVWLIYAERLGVILPNYSDRYRTTTDSQAVNAVLLQELDSGHWQDVEPGQEKFGDVVRFEIAGSPPHVGFVVGRGDMLHVLPGSGLSKLERFDTRLWRGRMRGIHRHVAPVSVFSREHALAPERTTHVAAGASVAEIVNEAMLGAVPGLQAWVGDIRVPREQWGMVRPKAGRHVHLVVVPEGGQGNNSDGSDRNKGARMILTIGVIAAAIAAPYAVGISGTVGGALLSAGAATAGSLLVNTLLPPPGANLSAGDSTTSRTIEGARNEVRQWGVVPQVMGLHRVVPPFGAAPYTEVVGDDQYLRLVFVINKGKTDLYDFKIGETAIEEYEGVQIEVRNGYPDDAPLTLYPDTVVQDDLAIALTQAAGWITQTTQPNTDQISLDISFLQGLAQINADGSRSSRAVAFDVEYAPAGSGSWVALNEHSPGTAEELDFLFRTPEQVWGGRSIQAGRIAWGSGFPDAKPGYLPASNFSWIAYGWLRVTAEGVHTFALDASDAADLVIDGETVVSWYGSHAPIGGGGTPDFTTHMGSKMLSAGWHQFQVRVECRTAGGNLAVGMQEPGGSMAILPYDRLWRRGWFNAAGLDTRWYDTSSYAGAVVVEESRTEQIRRSVAIGVSRGQYDVRIRRNTTDSTSNYILDAATLTALRSITFDDPVGIPGLAKIALRIKATDQLQGVVDNFNCMAQSIVPDWDSDSGTWIERATSNPASLYRAVLQGSATRRPVQDSRLNLPAIQDWHESNEALVLEFNAVFDSPGTVFQRLSDIAVCGRASHGLVDGLFTPIRDKPQTIPRQHFTPRNSRNFKLRKAFPRLPHALRVQFLNKDAGYQRDERIVLDDGYKDADGLDAWGNPAPSLPEATEFESIEILGVTSAAEAYKHGRYHIASARLRPAVYSLSTDPEHFPVNRGDLVLVTHDVPQWGLASGRVREVVLDGGGNCTAIRVDELCPMETGTVYKVRVRLEDGSSLIRQVVTVQGNQSTLTFSSAIAMGDPMPKVDDLFMFGPEAYETRELVIKSIQMESDLGATITMVDHAPAVHTADEGTIPDFDPGITQEPDFLNGPAAPIIDRIQSDDYVMVRETDGTLSPRMVLFLRPPSGTRPIPNRAELKIRRKPDPPAVPAAPYETRPLYFIADNRVVVDRVEEGETYQIKLRSVTAGGRVSDWTSDEHTVIGKVLPPPDVVSFDVQRMVDGTRRYSWDLGTIPPDVAGVQIRFGPGGAGAWADLDPLHDGTLEGASPIEMNVPPAGSWRFAIKMVDTSGNLSVNELVIDRTLGAPRQDDIAVSQDALYLGWNGTRTNCFVSDDGTLEATSTTTWATLPSTWAAWNRWNLTPRTPITYVHTIDAGFVFGFEPAVDVAGDGDIAVEFAYSSDNVTYSGYAPISDFAELATTARYARFRVTVAASVSGPVPRLTRLVMSLRAQLRVHTVNDLDTSTLTGARRLGVGDIRIPVPAGLFTVIQHVNVSFNGTGAGWTYELLDRGVSLGPRVRLFNPSGSLQDAVIDASVSGYG